MSSPTRYLSLLCLATMHVPLAPAPAQQPTEGALVASHRRAAAIVQAGVEAHGGLAAVRGLQSIAYSWEGVTYERLSGRDAARAFDPEPPTQPVRVSAAADLRRGRWMTELDMTAPGGIRAANRTAVDGRVVVNYDALGYAGGRSYVRDTVAAGAPAPTPWTDNLMPILLLRHAIAREASLRYLGAETVDGREEHLVTHATPSGGVATLRFDGATRLLVGVEGLAVDPLLGDATPTWRFSDFQREGALVVPRAFVHHNARDIQVRARLASLTVDRPLADSLLAPPAGFVPRRAVGEPSLVELGGGAYVVERADQARFIFVDTDEGLVAFDAPGSAGMAAQALSLVERALPGRALRYVVLTHHHGELLGGLSTYLARGATLLVPRGTEPYFRRLLAVPRTFGAWTSESAAPTPTPTIEAVADRRRIGRVERMVEVIDVGGSAHASAMLMGWVPAPRLLLQGDLLRVYEHGGAVPAQPASELEAIVRRLSLPVAQVVGARGRRGSLAELVRPDGAPLSATGVRPADPR